MCVCVLGASSVSIFKSRYTKRIAHLVHHLIRVHKVLLRRCVAPSGVLELIVNASNRQISRYYIHAAYSPPNVRGYQRCVLS